MENQWMALAISFLFVIFILAVTTVISKVTKGSNDLTRKMIHIGVGHWIIIAMMVFSDLRFLLVTPCVFIVVNYISYRYNIIGAMEQEDDSLGTVWYALSLAIMSMMSVMLDNKSIAIVGILTMAYGDGFAAIIGRRFGNRKLPTPYEEKSYLGSLTMFVLTVIVINLTTYWVNGRWMVISSIVIAAVATLVECMSRKGRDNLFVPIVTGLAYWLAGEVTFGPEFFVMMLLAAIILAFGFIKESITFSGMIHGLFVAFIFIVYARHYVFYGLIAFFIIGSLISKIGKNKKKLEEKIHARSGPRNEIQVYANAGGAVLFVLLGEWSHLEVFDQAALIVFIAALADTMSSEIGMLSKKPPINIVTWRPIDQGLSGGVTLLGLMAGFVGALIMSLLLVEGSIALIVSVAMLGFLGSIVDSILGALLQEKFYDTYEQRISEKTQLRESFLPLVSGIKGLNNDWVNFISTLFVSLVYISFTYLFLL